MKGYFFLALVVITFSGRGTAQPYKTGEELLRAMHTKYKQAPCKCYTFSQKNTHYKGDSITGYSDWHETIRYPDYFKISFGDTTSGNSVVFQNDSVYNYKNSQLMRSRTDSSTLLLLLGGMYYRPYKEVVARLTKADYDLNQIASRQWIKQEVWVIGNVPDGNQIWITKKDHRIVRLLEKTKALDLMDMRFESHERWCRGWIETSVSFRRNGELEQVEDYYNIKTCQ